MYACSNFYFLFNGWTTCNSKHSFIGICIHHLNCKTKIVDYLIALLKLFSCYTGINYAKVIGNVFIHFNVSKKKLSYFIINNAANNGIYINHLFTKFNFKKENC